MGAFWIYNLVLLSSHIKGEEQGEGEILRLRLRMTTWERLRMTIPSVFARNRRRRGNLGGGNMCMDVVAGFTHALCFEGKRPCA